MHFDFSALDFFSKILGGLVLQVLFIHLIVVVAVVTVVHHNAAIGLHVAHEFAPK